MTKEKDTFQLKYFHKTDKKNQCFWNQIEQSIITITFLVQTSVKNHLNSQIDENPTTQVKIEN